MPIHCGLFNVTFPVRSSVSVTQCAAVKTH